MSKATYTATSLEDIAELFERRAQASRAPIGSNIRVTAIGEAKAKVWREAAEILRNTSLEPQP